MPTIEYGVVRRNGGDAEFGASVALGGSLGHADAVRGLSDVGGTMAGQRRTRGKRSCHLFGNPSEIPHLGGNLLVQHTVASGFGPEFAR